MSAFAVICRGVLPRRVRACPCPCPCLCFLFLCLCCVCVHDRVRVRVVFVRTRVYTCVLVYVMCLCVCLFVPVSGRVFMCVCVRARTHAMVSAFTSVRAHTRVRQCLIVMFVRACVRACVPACLHEWPARAYDTTIKHVSLRLWTLLTRTGACGAGRLTRTTAGGCAATAGPRRRCGGRVDDAAALPREGSQGRGGGGGVDSACA